MKSGEFMMTPAIAVAAAVAGLMRWTMPPLPMRPLKLRFVVEAADSPPGQHAVAHAEAAPQVGFVTQKPASMKISMSPSFNASR